MSEAVATITIEKDIPIPEAKAGSYKGSVSATLRTLEIGESFLAPPSYKRQSIGNMAQFIGKTMQRKFAVRSTPDGIRVWRSA